MSQIKDLFKPYLSVKTVYKGGLKENKNIKFYKLSSNENPLGASPLALKAISKHTRNLHIYPDNTDQRMREALAVNFNHELLPEQFISASSGSEILDIIVRAFLNVGDEVITSNPCFLPYFMFSSWQGAKIVNVPLKGKKYKLDTESILKHINPKTKIIFLTSPNNPTGSYIPKKTLTSFLNSIPNNILIVFDEVYRHFTDKKDYTSALPYVKQNKNIIGLNSFSKSYGLAGIRLGYCYTTLEIANYIRQICKPFLIPILSLEAGLAALKDTVFLKDTKNLIKKERAYYEKNFNKLRINYTPSQANFFLITPPIEDSKFVNYMYSKHIMVRPVTNFGAPGKVRITIGKRRANKAVIDALKEVN